MNTNGRKSFKNTTFSLHYWMDEQDLRKLEGMGSGDLVGRHRTNENKRQHTKFRCGFVSSLSVYILGELGGMGSEDLIGKATQ